MVDIFTTISFIVLVSLPMMIKLPIFNFNTNNENNEKRALAQKPDFKMINLLEFPKAYEEYFNDNFGFRQLLIKWNNFFKVNICNSSPSISNVILGKEGWLFYAGERVIEDFSCTIPFSEEELIKIKMIQEEREQWLKNQGISYYIVIPPNKHTIYSEYLPINRVGEISRLDQVISYLKKNSHLKIIDLRSELFKEKEHHLLYYMTDTHWNDLGAFFAYQKVISEIKAEYPQIKPLVLTDFSINSQIANGGDLALMLSMSDSLKEERYVLAPKKEIKAKDGAQGNYQDPSYPGRKAVIKVTNDNNLPNLVMFRDSFSTALIPYLSENFNRSSYFWTHSFVPEVILKEKPNIVILETVERYIHNLLIENPKLN